MSQMSDAQQSALETLVEVAGPVVIGFASSADDGEPRIHHKTAEYLAGCGMATIDTLEDGTRVCEGNIPVCQNALENVAAEDE